MKQNLERMRRADDQKGRLMNAVTAHSESTEQSQHLEDQTIPWHGRIGLRLTAVVAVVTITAVASGIMSVLTFQEFLTAFQKNTTETTTGFETLISSVQKVTEEAEVAFGVIDSQIVDMETSTQTALQTIETSVNLTLDQELPKLIEVFSIAERSKTIIAAAPTLVAATNTKMLEERFGALTEANEEMTAMVTKLAADESFDQNQIKTLTDAAAGLSASLAGLKTLVEERLATDSKIATQLQEGEKVRSAALEVLERITDQEISQSIQNINQLSASDITLLVALAELRSGTNRLSGTLSQR